jgi:hypothetical protein
MNQLRIFDLLWLALPLCSACATSDPTTAVLINQYPVLTNAGSASGSTTVYQAWWAVALFAEPVPAGQESDPVRVVEGTDYAYALLAPGWDPTSGTPVPPLIPIRSAQKLSAARGDTLNIALSDATTVGNCAAGQPLSADDAAFITQRIFPGAFTNVVYDATTCTSSVAPSDAGGDGAAASSDGG